MIAIQVASLYSGNWSRGPNSPLTRSQPRATHLRLCQETRDGVGGVGAACDARSMLSDEARRSIQ
eukprot:6182085-Pleurochrysis_carterae.AAC.1